MFGWQGENKKEGGQGGCQENNAVYISSQGDKISEDLNKRLKRNFLTTLCRRPNDGVTEVRWLNVTRML